MPAEQQPHGTSNDSSVVGKFSLTNEASDSMDAPLFAVVLKRKICLCLIPEGFNPKIDPVVMTRIRPDEPTQAVAERVELLFM